YFALGHKVGYLPEAHVHHYYIGELAELHRFTADFTIGEMKYLSQEPHEAGRQLLDEPKEWICQGSWNPHLARTLLRISIRDLALLASRPRRMVMLAAVLARWLLPAVAGVTVARIAAAAKVWWATANLKAAILIGRRARLSAAFRGYVAAVIEDQRLKYIRVEQRDRTRTSGSPRDLEAAWNVFARENAGFHPIEVSGKIRF